MSGCTDEDFGYTVQEVRQSVVERNYVKAFHEEFPSVDPSHTWMCTPDTFHNEWPVVVPTRALSDVPSVSAWDPSVTVSMSYVDVQQALDYMKEAEDNRGKCAQDFEYKAIDDEGRGFETYTITPTFWGRKFCADNSVGIYYIDSDNQKHELQPFWTDRQNHIKVYFKDGHVADLTNSEQQIVDDPSLSNYARSVPLTHACSTCGGRRVGPYPCPDCVDGKSPVDHYELPQYTLQVPVGMKWGVYLKTRRQQNRSQMITWYSNSQYNDLNHDGTNSHVKAAATFTYNGTTYVSFEDAPTVCSSNRGTGECSTCGRGHYDKDYNDIVLTITPRPVESTYRSIKYRVMCEDLGGTFDWDFNDVVYDVIYADGKTFRDPATVTIILQAVGGTLPIYLLYDDPANPALRSKSDELHFVLSGQSADDGGAYTPVNVTTPLYATVTGQPARVLKTIILSKQRYSDAELDVRSFVRHITVQAVQDGVPTSQVIFPREEADAVPQCFMTSTGTEWADELQKITLKYPRFSSWVASQQSGIEWWFSDPNF